MLEVWEEVRKPRPEAPDRMDLRSQFVVSKAIRRARPSLPSSRATPSTPSSPSRPSISSSGLGTPDSVVGSSL